MPVPGPRQRAPPPRQSAAPSARNEVFENIFGRPSGAHHLGHPGQPHALPHPGLHPGPPPGHPGYPPGQGPPRQAYDRFDPYAQYAPPPPPPQQVYNPAQPSYPPGQGSQGQPRPQSTQPYPPAYQQRPQRPYPPQPQQQQHPQQRFPDPYRPAPPYDGQGQANGRLQQQYTGNSQAESMSNRRASFAPSISVTPNFTSAQAGYNPAQGQNPSQQQPNGGRGFNNGYPGAPERLPPIASLQPPTEDPYGGIAAGGPSIIQPKPRSSSATTNISSTSSTATITPANVPPRSRSLHNQTGRGGIRLTIPSGGPQHPPGAAQPGVPGHPVALQDAQEQVSVLSPIQMPPTPDRADTSPPPDYLQAFNAVSLNSSGRRTPGPLDDIEGIPDRQSADLGKLGLLHGPWDQEHGARPGPSVRQSSSSASSFSTNHRRRHSRMPSDSSIASSVYTVSGQRMAPLSQIGATGTPDSPFGEPTTPTGSENGYGNLHRLSARKSMESTHSLPLPATVDSPLPPGAANSVYDHRAMSFSGTGVNRRDIVEAVRAGSLHGRSRSINNGSGSPVTAQRSLIRNQSSARLASTLNMVIIPALLSNVAEAFRQLIQPGELLKEGITYKDSFDGRTAVSIIADIIKTPDRNLALLLGRALDAQKFFHDVTYAHRLRDTPNEVYQFKERLVAPFMPGDTSVNDSPTSDHLAIGRPSSAAGIVGRPRSSRHNAGFELPSSDSHTSLVPASPAALTKVPSPGATPVEPADDSDDDLPNGVFTLLTECYSPTCSREQLCYSINCPRRLEQMKRLNMKSTHLHPGLNRKIEDESLADDKQETGTLWIHSVPQEIVDSVDDREKKRQEAINEVIYTERDFVRGLEYLRDSWIKPLRSNDVIEATRRDDFVRQVFWNVHDVLTVNLVLAERLTKRQKQQPVVQAIGDIFIDCVPHFEPFVVYGAHQLFGKYEFEKEKGANPGFQKFVDETERKPESRKLELNGYLTKPTTRLGRYPLLLEAVLKYTPDDHPDKKDLPEVIKQIRAYLQKVNIESGKSENIFELAQIEQQLSWTRTSTENGPPDLLLRDKNRELLHKGPMKRRGGGNTQGGSENADLLAFLFDHAFLLVKPKWVNKAEQYRVYRRPVPLELLVVTTPEDVYNSAKLSASSRGNKLISRNASKGNSLAHVPPKPDSKHGYSITVTCLGRRGWSMQLWVDTYVGRKKWIECIDKQQQVIRDKNLAFVPETITDSFFQGLRRINCISPYDNGNRMIYGTDEGVYFSNLRDPKLREPVKVINLLDVTQVDVIEEFQLLLVLHERSVTTFPLDCLDPNDPNAALKRGKRVSSHTSFFKSGICLGRTLIAVVKSSPLSSTIKVLEPIDQNMRGKKPQTGFMKRLNGGQETLKLFKEFYIPLESFSVHFLKTKLCVGCQKGFEIVDLETLDMQSLLDPSDSKLDFVLKRDGPRPMAIFRIEGDFLLCYDYFAFYVNKSGWRSRLKWSIVWESAPTAFALQYPYVIAFDPSFIEVRHVESGALIQTFAGSNIRCLFADMPPSTVNAPMMAPNRQLMYPGPQQGMYRPPPQAMGYPGQPPPQLGFPTPHTAQGPGFRPPMPGYGMPPPMAPMRNFAFRPQIIFTSEDGHVQFLKLAPPNKNHQNPNRRLSDSRSVHSMRAV